MSSSNNNQELTGNTPMPVPEEQQGNQSQTPYEDQPQGQTQDQTQTNEDTSMPDAPEINLSSQTNDGIYAAQHAPTLSFEEQDAILRKRVEDTMKERFKQDNAPSSTRKLRKKRHEEALEDLKAFTATQQALNPTSEREVVPRNMPGLQVLGGPVRFEDRDMHESITAFFTAFEAQLHSHKLNLDKHWERLFWQCLDNHQRSWFQRTLHGKHLSWVQAQQHIEKEYGNPCHTWQKGQELYELRQERNQPIREYVEEFESLAREAARIEDDRLCKDFIYSLDESVRTKLYPVLASTYPLQDPTNLREVALLAVRTLGEHMEVSTTSTINRNNKRQRTTGSNSSTTRQVKNRRKYGNCPIHKHGSHDKEQCNVLQRLREVTQQPKTGYNTSRMQSKSSPNVASTHSNLCRHCNKVPFTYEHLKVCQEYQSKRQGKDTVHNRSITVTNTSSSHSRADEIYDFCAGQLANMDLTG
ncbi:hypothetical protein K492DRAFT_227231 [Lichtheimia hyalospora FSU 10163]|nr:hypothetical protein K492DRAFT_227231 [Lichtheimia hyalospora FSU 10163]